MRKNFSRYNKEVSPETVIHFLNDYLPNFNLKEFDYIEGDREGLINSEIWKYLQSIASMNGYRFIIEPKPENRKNKNEVDFAVHTYSDEIKNSKIFYTIEAKRLPARKGHEKEYVCGELGGIERFKRNKHGIDKNGKLLPSNAMIAYIEKYDFEYWYHQINEWIIEQANISADLKWTKYETLEKISFDKIATLQSTHLRINNENVMLNHFWIYLQH